MKKVTPFLWFDGKAEEAAKFYTSIFKNSSIKNVKHWAEGSPFPKEQAMSVSFELDGQQFYAMDAGPQFKFTEAISMFVSCENQEEIDYFWDKLSQGGEIQMCGWLKDKFGLSWQIVPSNIDEMIGNKDPEKSKRAVQALMGMKKIVIADLKNA